MGAGFMAVAIVLIVAFMINDKQKSSARAITA